MRRQSVIRRLYNFTWRYKMTPAGKVLSGLIGVSSLGTVSTQVPVFQVCCGLLGLLVVAEVVGVLFKPNLTVAATWPQSMDVGELVSVPVKVTNASRWRSAHDLMVMLINTPPDLRHLTADRFFGRLRPGETVEFAVVIQATRRGRVTIGAVDVHSTFPFNLIRVPGGRTGPETLTVSPIGPPLRRFDLPVEQGSHEGQLVLSGRTGESLEYLGNREYAPGEPVRRLDFRAWARLGKPVVREYQDEFASRVGILVDTLGQRRRFGRHSLEGVEEAICIGVSTMRAITADDFDVAWLATATDLYVFSEEMRRGQDQEFLDRLALTIPTTTPVYDRMLDSLVAEAESCASVVVILSGWDESRQELVDQLATLSTPVKVVLVNATDSVPEVDSRIELVNLPIADVRSGEIEVI